MCGRSDVLFLYMFFFFKQKTAYDMRISDWSSDVCSSDLLSKEHASSSAGDRQGEVATPELITRYSVLHVRRQGSSFGSPRTSMERPYVLSSVLREHPAPSSRRARRVPLGRAPFIVRSRIRLRPTRISHLRIPLRAT